MKQTFYKFDAFSWRGDNFQNTELAIKPGCLFLRKFFNYFSSPNWNKRQKREIIIGYHNSKIKDVASGSISHEVLYFD